MTIWEQLEDIFNSGCTPAEFGAITFAFCVVLIVAGSLFAGLIQFGGWLLWRRKK